MLSSVVRIFRTVNRGRLAVLLSIAGLLLMRQAVFPVSAWSLNADQLLIVSNRAVSASGRLARTYMERRAVPKENWLQVNTTDREQIERADYEKQIAAPLREFLLKHDPQGTRYRCIVLMYGLPLRVQAPPFTEEEQSRKKELQQRLKRLEKSIALLDEEQETERKGLQQEAAAVRRIVLRRRQFHQGAAIDSELALIREEPYPLKGWTPNRLFLGYSGSARDKLLKKVLLVSRLDGPSPEVVRRMIDDSLAAEQTGLTGMAYFDARWPRPGDVPTSAYRRYDAAIHNTAGLLRRSDAVLVVLDDQERLFQSGQAPAAALYNGWYSLGEYVDAFDWVQGAVGFHVASGECTTLKKEGSRVWCKAMLEDGVAATVGPVAEPYLQSFPSPEIFFGCLVQGRRELAECYAMANPFWSWQMVLLGDPLYRPFKKHNGRAQVHPTKGADGGL